MPLPIAHGLMGASIVIAGSPSSPRLDDIQWDRVLLGAVLSILPDLDSAVIWSFGFSPTWHRGFSHSILMAVVVGALSSCLVKPGTRIRWGIIFGSAIASHGLMDALVSVRGGVELLWPLSSHRFALGLYEYPETVIVNYNSSVDLLAIKNEDKLLYASALEFMIMGAVFIVTWVVKRNLKVRAKDL
jgi:membrane-bound metal-dependent hydrolase YbcI (DUF457 family)